MEAVVDQPVAGSETGGTGNQQTQAPGWLAGLPAELRDNEAFKPYRTVGDFAKSHLDTAKKAKEYEEKLTNSIPKLGENATQEERDRYFTSLGRPEKPEDYQLEGGDKEKEAILAPWKQDFHELGFTASQASGIKAKFDARINRLVDDHKAESARMDAIAEAGLKTKWGDKYSANLELVSRVWKKEMDSDLDTVFGAVSPAVRAPFMNFFFKMAAKTGEDLSSRGAGQRSESPKPGYDLSAFKLPAART